MKTLSKPWGFEEILLENDRWIVKRLVVNDGHRTSLQFHKQKSETWYWPHGETTTIKPFQVHRLVGPIEIIEVADAGHENDIVRVEDDFGRA